jgi:hypothetical protein
VGKLADNMAESADVLRQLLAAGVKETVRLGAARANLELGVKLHESVELEERLAALERASGVSGEHPQPAPPPPLAEVVPTEIPGHALDYEQQEPPLPTTEVDDGEFRESPQ